MYQTGRSSFNISLEEKKKRCTLSLYLTLGGRFNVSLEKIKRIYIAYRYIEPGGVGSICRLKKNIKCIHILNLLY